MDEKEAEARPVMGTIFLVNSEQGVVVATTSQRDKPTTINEYQWF